MSKIAHSLARLSTAALVVVSLVSPARASQLVEQKAVPGRCIPRFQLPLPTFGSGDRATLPRVDAGKHRFLQITMKETSQQVLPPHFADEEGCPDERVGPTRVWTYETRDLYTGKVLGPAHWPAVTLDVDRYNPLVVRYVNELPAFDPSGRQGGLVQGLLSVDQTLHWAAPGRACDMGDTGGMGFMTRASSKRHGGRGHGHGGGDHGGPGDMSCLTPYVGPPPAVAHLHGGEVPSEFDGNPDAWFTPGGEHGTAYESLERGRGIATYWYPNAQEPGTLWFHDHAMGITRLNVYGGLAAFYLLRDPASEPAGLPSGNQEIELAIQDRQFDRRGQLFFPDGSGADADATNLNGTPPNPDVHPLWIPEFVGDVIVVNGTPWPYLDVEPRRYRFRIVDGSNARFYNLSFGDAPVYQIGADDAYLDAPVRVKRVFLAPGERADLIVDFSELAGRKFVVTNDAVVPFPDGLVPGDPGQEGMGEILKFRVILPTQGKDGSCNPAKGGCRKPASMVRLADAKGNGKLAPGVKADRVRQLILKEIESDAGPLEVLVNNTKFEGQRSPNVAVDFPRDGVTELPAVGSTEIWEIANLTGDAHPMHTHLVQFQILDRRPLRLDDAGEIEYLDAYAAAFGGKRSAPLPPGCSPGEICAGYGPPLPYRTPNADGALGGNPAFSGYLVPGAARGPAPEESGWKDTAKALPGEVLRLAVRWAPTSASVKAAWQGRNLYPFDPTSGPGYVWHCHIIDHEDNEMMRPYRVTW